MVNNDLLTLRETLITEAKNSPMLLSDLAGLEIYVSESYDNRSFVELLQNADDAKATRFSVKRCGDYLLVANNGRPFNKMDLESLCRSASSNKDRGTSIGYRGIGFKSVVGIAKEVHLVSGDFEITFSKDQTKQIIPQASKVPLIRIPHNLDRSVKNLLVNEIKTLQDEGYKTIFIFSGLIANKIDEEYTSFTSTTILFLNNIQAIEIHLNKKITASITVLEENNRGRVLRVSTTDAISNWLVCSSSNCSIAFSIENNRVVRLPENEATIHSFLPTEDSCGLGVVVNGDFSTDPSRRHLIMDDNTQKVISSLSNLFAFLWKDALERQDKNILDALMPYFDLKLIQFMKQSFEKEFAIRIKESFGKRLSYLKLAPSWLNTGDYAKIMAASKFPYITPECSEVYGLNIFLKFLGCKTQDIGTLLSIVSKAEISVLGYAQLVAAGIKELLMNHHMESLINTNLVVSNGNLYSLKTINEKRKKIDESFVQLLNDNGVSKNDIRWFLKKMKLTDIDNIQFSDEDKGGHNNRVDGDTAENTSIVSRWYDNAVNSKQIVNNEGIQRWRSAEENALVALNAHGFRLKDVSKQNIGYDLEGYDPNGNNICIEVKSIDYVGQKFRMTNNEFAAAQFKQNIYYIALVFQNKETLKISLIKDPVNCLDLTRQCVQWVWECSDYEFKPMSFGL